MLVVIACPECGHLGRVPEKRLGHKVRCKGCGVTFRPDAASNQASPETKKSSKKDGPAKARSEWAVLGLLKNPTVIDGAVLGAIAGIMTGVILGAITEVIYAGPKKGVLFEESARPGPVASAIGGGIKGFITGFLGGTSIGALIGLVGVYFQSLSFSQGWSRIVSFGILIGATVTAIIVATLDGSHYEWLPVGAFIGAIGGLVWQGLQTWERASDQPIVKDFDLEEEEKPATPKTEL
jgi:hypothetical protein